jgi:hypothetical protein
MDTTTLTLYRATILNETPTVRLQGFRYAHGVRYDILVKRNPSAAFSMARQTYDYKLALQTYDDLIAGKQLSRI